MRTGESLRAVYAALQALEDRAARTDSLAVADVSSVLAAMAPGRGIPQWARALVVGYAFRWIENRAALAALLLRSG